MGNKYTVEIWMQDFREKWCYVEKYNGNSFFLAIYYILKEKISGSDCTKFTWR
jgi:hypothetical protein